MLLALWSGFWNPAAWVQGPTPPPVVFHDPGAGHGKKQYNIRTFERADQDYWDIREKALRQKLPPSPEAPKPAEKPVVKTETLVGSLPKVNLFKPLDKFAELDTNYADIVYQLALQTQRVKAKSDDEALLALLL